MTVKELRDELQEYPDDMVLFAYSDNTEDGDFIEELQVQSKDDKENLLYFKADHPFEYSGHKELLFLRNEKWTPEIKNDPQPIGTHIIKSGKFNKETKKIEWTKKNRQVCPTCYNTLSEHDINRLECIYCKQKLKR